MITELEEEEWEVYERVQPSDVAAMSVNAEGCAAGAVHEAWWITTRLAMIRMLRAIGFMRPILTVGHAGE